MLPLVAPTSPLMQLSKVDLPAPLGPMMATMSPSATSKEMPCNTSLPL